MLKNGLTRLSAPAVPRGRKMVPFTSGLWTMDILFPPMSCGFSWFHQWELGTSASIPQMKSQPRWATTGSYSPVGVYPHMYDIKSKEVQSITPSDRPDRFRKTCEIMLNSYRDLRQNQGLTIGEGAKRKWGTDSYWLINKRKVSICTIVIAILTYWISYY